MTLAFTFVLIVQAPAGEATAPVEPAGQPAAAGAAAEAAATAPPADEPTDAASTADAPTADAPPSDAAAADPTAPPQDAATPAFQATAELDEPAAVGPPPPPDERASAGRPQGRSDNPREGVYIGIGLAPGASITDEAVRYGGDGYMTKLRLDAELGVGLDDRFTLGLGVHYTPHFAGELPSAQGAEVPFTAFVGQGFFIRVAPGLDLVPDRDQTRWLAAIGGVLAGGIEWPLGRRLGLSFDVGLDVRAVPVEGAVLVGGFNRIRVTWY